MNGMRDYLEPIARVGYAARGTVYLIVGALAVLAGLGRGGATTGSKGALQTLMEQPFGMILLGIVAVGLLCFAVWRGIQCVIDPDHVGMQPKGLAKRGGYGMAAVIYLGLASFAFHLVLGLGHRLEANEDGKAQDWTALLMAQPFGVWLVGIIGAAIIATGVAMGISGWKARFQQRLALNPEARRWAIPIGRAGFIARGIVFAIIGALLIAAAIHHDPSEAKGLGGSLKMLQAKGFGPWLLCLIGLGLAAFGAFGFVQAIYRRIHTEGIANAINRLRGGAVVSFPR